MDVDVASMRTVASQLEQVEITRIGPKSGRGPGTYGYPRLTTAAERFIESLDKRLVESVTDLRRLVEGLRAAANDFEDNELWLKDLLDRLGRVET
jgi:hypothetical protein